MPQKIFISYSKQTPEPTKALAAFLQAQGHSVWWDTDLKSGEVFREVIDRELDAADAVIVIWTEASVRSHWVDYEAKRARKQNKLVPVRLASLDPDDIPPPFHVLHTDLVDDRAAILRALARFDGSAATQQAQQPQAAVAPPPAMGGAASLEWSKAEWETLKHSTDIGRLTRFAAHAHPYYADDARDRIAELLAQTAREDAEAAKRKQREAEEAERKRQEQARYAAEGRIEIDAAIVNNPQGRWFLPGAGKTEWFQDFDAGPEMVVVPAGKFLMGSPENEPQRHSNESPQHEVTIPKAFAAGRFPVTFDEWDAAVSAGGVAHKPGDAGWGRGKRPVINVSVDDAAAYITWLNGKVNGGSYRLLSEAEWEYVCRAGTVTPFWWGSSITPEQANYNGSADPYKGGGAKGEYRQSTLPVESFKPNPWGLYQVHGNVWEWCADCWNDSYQDKPANLKATGATLTTGDCDRRALRGGSWDYYPGYARAATRDWDHTTSRDINAGFRLARTL